MKLLSEVLKPRTDGERPKETSTVMNLFILSKDKNGIISHIYKPVKKVTTIWVLVRFLNLTATVNGLRKTSARLWIPAFAPTRQRWNISHIYRKVEKQK